MAEEGGMVVFNKRTKQVLKYTACYSAGVIHAPFVGRDLVSLRVTERVLLCSGIFGRISFRPSLSRLKLISSLPWRWWMDVVVAVDQATN